MTSLKQIEDFFAAEPVAMVGVSRNPKKFGYAAFRELKDKGLKVIPVNPNASEILGEKVFPDVQALPPEVKSLIIVTNKEQTASVIRAAKEKGMKNIWIQQMADSAESKKEIEGSGINCITGQCVLMYYKPNGMHKFHGALKKFFGSYPK